VAVHFSGAQRREGEIEQRIFFDLVSQTGTFRVITITWPKLFVRRGSSPPLLLRRNRG
jgi:hypothetical protein